MNLEDTTNLQCDERKSIKDDDTVISDRCWQEMHRGDSRKWLIRDASKQKMDSSVCSTMKSSYRYPFHENREEVVGGVRRYLLRKQLYEEIKDEVLREQNEERPVEEYCTEYDGNFNGDGYHLEEEYKIDSELMEKYPLYSSPATSYWSCQYQTSKDMQGVTNVTDCKHPFRRSYKFSKPISEVLDE